MTPTLHDLTGGQIDTLGELTEAKIDAWLGHPIEPGAKAPLFDTGGNAIRDKDGRQLALSYTHAAAFAADIIARSQRDAPQTTHDVADLPIPFWNPTDVVLLSKDHQIIAAMRSNATRNAVGRCLTAAAGFPKVIDGCAESSLQCARRELHEETGLVLPEIAEKTLDIGIITQRPLQHYTIKTADGQTLPGIVPSVVSTVAVRSHRTAAELMKAVKPNHESAGFAVIHEGNLEDLAQRAKTAVPATFYPSTLLKTISLGADPSGSLASLRKQLESPETAKPQHGQYALQVPRSVALSRDDFSHNGTYEALEKTSKAASVFSYIGISASARQPSH